MPLVDTKFFMSQVLQNKCIKIWTIISLHLWPKLTILIEMWNIACLFTQMLNLIKFTLEGSLSLTHKNFGVYPLHLSVVNNDDRNLHA